MHIVSISSLKGGVGKTSVTSGLASAALEAGLRTLVVDLDPHADLSTALGLPARRESSIGDLLKRPKRAVPADHVRSSSWTALASRAGAQDRPYRLDVLGGSAVSGVYDRPDLSRRDLRRLETVLERAEGYDLALIDCPPSFSGLTRMAWTTSDDVVLVAEPGLFSVAGTERTLRALRLFSREYAPGLVGRYVVANRVREDFSEHAYRIGEMREMFGDALLETVLPEYHEWQQIQGAAYPVHQWPTAGAREAAQRFDTLLAEIRRNQA
ncbi:ParA family protein [Arthrobacter sp. UM1]|uniref:ParA family protein n=1 Tax=Arthrobacter sp. UM1 TaxID=2766776 RepID=UPI001CF69C11|nr:ParA family protein [Arthrobacter sp. UM1]MCB4207724.1 ParA family protein [Arthrobacter sp. UM1]